MEVEDPGEEMSVDEVSRLVEAWANEVKDAGEVEEDEEGMGMMQEAWDDVPGGELPIKEVKAARREEINYMVERKIWSAVPVSESWEKTKGGEGAMEVRCRLVARDFKGKEKGGDDLLLRHHLWRRKGCY